MLSKFSIISAALGAALMFNVSTASAQAQASYGLGEPAQAADLPSGLFRSALEALPPQARGRALGILQRVTTPAADFDFMRVDKRGGVFYVDPLPDEADESGTEPQLEEAVTETDVFKLHSKPGALSVLYVDFDGHVLIGTVWNANSGQTELDMLPFNPDGGDPYTFTQAELTRIAESWRRVAEDFAPFDIDVTTEEPPYTTGADGRRNYASNVGHNLVTRKADANGNDAYSCSCGGVAYYNAFGNNYSQPGLTFNSSLGSNALTISHETGHTLYLSHDGGASSAYYGGHGFGETSWGPIMGAPWNKSVTTWSKGEYPDATNNQDDFDIINSFLAFRADDHTDNTLNSATPLLLTDSTNVVGDARVTDPKWSSPSNRGVIEDANDIDLFSMSVGVGTIALNIDPANLENYEGGQGANLDIQARLLDNTGAELEISNPELSVAASFSYTVTVPGTYYLEITGVGNPGGGGDDYGYSSYSSVGQYYINGTLPEDVIVTGPPTAPGDLAAALSTDTSIQLTWTDTGEPSESNETAYRVYRSVDGVGFGLRATIAQDSQSYDDNNLSNGAYRYYLEVYNASGTDITAETAPITINLPIFAVATSESTALGLVSSGSYVNTQNASGSETLSEHHSGGKPQNRQTYLDHSWFVTGVAAGDTVQLDVTASAPSNTDSDNFIFTYSVDNGAWQALDTLLSGTGETTMTAAFAGSSSGTVEVRVEDTDRTIGNRNIDTVSVSLIAVTSSGDPGEQVPTVSITDPADGTIVAGGTVLNFTAVADDTEDGDLSDWISWSSDVQGGLGINKANITATLTGGSPDVTHVITASVTDSAEQTATDTITVTVSDTPAATTMVVGTLTGSGSLAGKGGKWQATVSLTVFDDLNDAVSGVLASGTWSNGTNGSGSCTTDSSGSCDISKGGLKNNTSSVTFTVSDVSGGSLTYDAGGSATSVVISKP
jgi:hypothetical protein